MRRLYLASMIMLASFSYARADDRFVLLWHYRGYLTEPSLKLGKTVPSIEEQATIVETETGKAFRCRATFSNDGDTWIDDRHVCSPSGTIPGSDARSHHSYAIWSKEESVEGTSFARIDQDHGTITFCLQSESGFVCTAEIPIVS